MTRKDWENDLERYFRRYKNGHFEVVPENIRLFISHLLSDQLTEIEKVLEGMKHTIDEKIFPYEKFKSSHDEADGFNVALTNILSHLKAMRDELSS